MKRIDTADRDIDKHGTGRDGYKDGQPPGQAPTSLNAAQFDHLQEELARTVEKDVDVDHNGAHIGDTLDDGNLEQVASAIARHFARYAARSWSIGPRSAYANTGGFRSGMDGGKPTAMEAGHSVENAGEIGMRGWVFVGGMGASEPVWGYSRSPNGEWWAQTRMGTKSFGMNDVTFSPFANHWIAVGDADGADAYICTNASVAKANAFSWIEQANPSNLDLYAVHADQGNQLRTGFGGTVTSRTIAAGQETGGNIYMIKSDDSGQTWALVPTPPVASGGAAARVSAVRNIPGTSTWVAGGRTNGNIADMWLSTDDGDTWAAPSTFTTSGVGDNVTGIAWNGSVFIAVGDGDVYWTSPDGDTWVMYSAQIPTGSKKVAADPTTGIIMVAAFESMRISYDDGVNLEMLTGVPTPSGENGWSGAFACSPGHEFGAVNRDDVGGNGYDDQIQGASSGQVTRGRRPWTNDMGTAY